MSRKLTFLILLLAPLGACATPGEPAVPGPPEPARARAALATLHVENRTRLHVTILYRHAIRAGAEVAVGEVPPRATAELAPVPAGEPLVLVARTPTGAEFTLPARSFEIDSRWTWLIPADARFRGGSR